MTELIVDECLRVQLGVVNRLKWYVAGDVELAFNNVVGEEASVVEECVLKRVSKELTAAVLRLIEAVRVVLRTVVGVCVCARVGLVCWLADRVDCTLPEWC